MPNHSHTYEHNSKISHLQLFTSSNNLSFSSTLLDQICRSIDDDDDVVFSMRKKRSDTHAVFDTEEQMANYRRACMIEKWMEKKVSDKIVVRGKSNVDLTLTQKDRQGSSSSSSDSSCGGFFSSSETESYPVLHVPKPVRTGGEPGKTHRNVSEPKPKHESGFLKTKSRALKMYGELKKVKQPISPGGKVAAFLNSIFAAGNLKKPKADSPSLNAASTCSSASSFSRSCLNKTKSSLKSGKLSVRFSPASTLVDEECRKSLHVENDVEFVNSAVDEAARDFLMNYRNKCRNETHFEDDLGKIDVENRKFEEDFDGESCGSSDLFELDNLEEIGMEEHERYREELPVYETTSLDKIQTMQMV